MILIGCAGRMGAGKTTFANQLLHRMDNAVRASFADPLRDAALAVFGSRYTSQEEKAAEDFFWSRSIGYPWTTGRSILQHLGTEVFRKHVHPDVWVLAAERRLLELEKRGVRVVIFDDVRYENEAAMIRRRGGTIIHICNLNQPEVVLPPWWKIWAKRPHCSEWPLICGPYDMRVAAYDVAELAEAASHTVARLDRPALFL